MGSPSGAGRTAPHQTAMQFDDNGNLVKVTLNDTGNPNGTNVCGREMKGTDLDNFNKSLAPGTQTNVA